MPLPAAVRTPLARSAALPFAALGVTFGAWAARIPDVQAALGLSEGALGLALLGLPLGSVAASLAAGPVIGRAGAHRTTLAASVASCLAVVGPGLAGSFASLVAWLVAMGAANGLLGVAINAWGAEVEAREGRPILSACHGLFSVGAMLGAGTGALAAALGWPPAAHFAVAGAMSAAVVVGQGVGLRPARAVRRDARPAFALPTGPLAGLAAFAFGALVVEGAMADWSGVYLREVLGASPGAAGLGFTAFALAMAVARFGGDRLTTALGDVRLVRLGAATGALGLGLAVVAPGVAAAVVGFGLVGLGFAAVVPALFRAATRVPGVAAGTGIGAVAGPGYVGMMAGPPAIGLLAEAAGLPLAFAALAALAIGLSAGAGWAFRAARRDPDPRTTARS